MNGNYLSLWLQLRTQMTWLRWKLRLKRLVRRWIG